MVDYLASPGPPRNYALTEPKFVDSYHHDPSPPRNQRRFDEWTKWVPIVFVSCIIVGLYVIYVGYHCIPLLQLTLPAEHVDGAMRQRAIIQLTIFHITTAVLVYCYTRSILISPGEIPDDPQWEREAADPSIQQQAEESKDNMQERKRSGDRRYCKWCGKYKPDRTHHCRVCKACILKMDHHCPWIYNCVGFRNHKYFFLLLFYSAITCQLVMWTMLESVKRSVRIDTPFVEMFLLLFGETLAFFLGTLVTAFFGFHIWLMMMAMTTIEFCEKSLKKGGSYDSSVYHSTCYGNIAAVLGDNVLYWLLPMAMPAGDGLNFVTDQTPLTKNIQEHRGTRKRTHQKVPRTRYAQSNYQTYGASGGGRDTQGVTRFQGAP